MRSHLASPERQELVDDDLRAVREIAELRLPDHQGLRVGEAVAVFEADHRRLRQRAVDDLERRLALADVVDRDVALFGLLIDQHRVAVRERAAAAVLAGHADMRALGAQRADRQRLGGRPVDALAALDRGALRLELPRDLAVQVKAFGHRHRARARPRAAFRAAPRCRRGGRRQSGAGSSPAQAPSSQSALFGR